MLTEDALEAALATICPSRGIAVAAVRSRDLTLYPEEAAIVANAVASRRADFAAGRSAARAALAKLGVPAGPIPSGPRRAPRWPSGFVGSISHAAGWAVAAAAAAVDASAIGVDVESARPLPQDVRALVVTNGDALAGPDELAATIAFSAKESVYKAIFPLCGWLLEFADVTLVVDARGSFVATAHDPEARSSTRTLSGRWCIVDDLVLTAAVLG